MIVTSLTCLYLKPQSINTGREAAYMTQIHTAIRDRPSAIKHQPCSSSSTIRQRGIDSLRQVSGSPDSQASQIILKLMVFCVLMFFFPQANSLKAHMKRMSWKPKLWRSKSWVGNLSSSSQDKDGCCKLTVPDYKIKFRIPKVVVRYGLCLALMVDASLVGRWFVCLHVCLLPVSVVRAAEELH